MRDKLIESLNRIFEDENCPMSAEAVGRIADRLMANGLALADDREMVGDVGHCEVGDTVYVPYYNEETGVTEIDELKITEVSQKRIWLCGDEGFDYSVDDIGKTVFLSKEDASAYVKSPEYLAERVNWVMLMNVSDNAKRVMLVKAFGVGQEYFEPETERYLTLTARGPFDVWKFDVSDENHEHMYSESALGVRLAIDILRGELVPAFLREQCKSKVQDCVEEIISEAKGRVGEESKMEREQELGIG